MKYKGIISLKGKGHCVQNCCNLLQVSPAGFYGWVNYKESHRKKRDNELKLMITNCFYKSKSSYAYPRITKKLEANGEMVGKNRVANLMKEQGLVATHKKAFRPKTTLNNPEHRKSDRVVKVENPLVSRPNKVWFSDLTYLPHYLKLLIFIVNRQEFICKKSKPDSKKLAKSLVFLKFAAVFLSLTAWTKTRFEWHKCLF